MTNDRVDEQKPRLNRGMELMLRNSKQRKKEGLFHFRIAKVISFFKNEIHLKIELKITKKHSGEKKCTV